MDPKACLLELIAEIYSDDPDHDRIEELVEAHEQWRGGQGFEPNFTAIDFAANESFKFYNVPKTGIGGDSLFALAKSHIAMRLDGCPYCGRMQLNEEFFNTNVQDGFAFEKKECANCKRSFEFKYAPCGMLVNNDCGDWVEVPFQWRKVVVVHVEGGIVQRVDIPSDDIIVEVHDRDDDSEEPLSVSEWKKDE